MDPKNPSQLDPKLKEAYDRVMGTNASPANPTPQPSTPTPQVPQQPVSPEPAAAPQVFTPSTAPKPQTVTISSQPQAATMVNSPSSTFVAKAGGAKSGGFSPILIIFGLLIFFIVYAIFWVKFFGISIPFLPL